MSRLSIDAQDLLMALESHSQVFQYFVDLQSGEVVFLADEAYVGKVDDDLDVQIEAEPERFRAIDSLPSFKGWQVMADFIEQLPSGKERVRLARAVQQSHPFRHNWMERDAAFADWVAAEVNTLGLELLQIDGKDTLEVNAMTIAAHFQLSADVLRI